jgi:multiple sugar transport system ATP-binding protein
MSNVIIDSLAKIYPQKNGPSVAAVNAINLTIEEGEFMVLVGPSGCGKSTTLRMIAGLEEISAGRVSIDGRVVNDILPRDRDIAMVFQNYALYPHMSVYDNMAFGLKLRKLPKAEIDARVREASAMLGLDPYLNRRPKALSGGQRQRVAVGRAIVRKPKVFLFDEPLSNLDAKMRVSTRTEIAKLHARLGATMIYVTHDQTEAMTLGDRICVMKDGNIMQVAAPLELYNHPANLFVAGFIGSPPMNFFQGSIQRSGDHLVFIEDNSKRSPVSIILDARLAARAANHIGQPVIFGIRPEDIEDSLATGSGTNCPTTIEAIVEISESMGSETYLHLDSGATSFIARVGAAARYESGQHVRLSFENAKACLFDVKSRQALL